MRVGNGVGNLELDGNMLGDGNAGTLYPKSRLRPRNVCADANETQRIRNGNILFYLYMTNPMFIFYRGNIMSASITKKNTTV